MEITSDQAYEWADNQRKKIIMEIDYLIEDLQASRHWLINKAGYSVDSSPEIRLKQIRKEQYKAESLAELADHIRYEEAVKKAREEG